MHPKPCGFCASCGYDLGGLGAGACPECGRAFDPADPGSYDRVPCGTRRARLLRRLAAGVLGLGLLIALFPRGYGEATMTVAPAGGAAVRIRRIQFIPPEWFCRYAGIRYPGWTWTTDPGSPAPGFKLSFRDHRFTLRGRVSGGSGSGTCGPDELGSLTVNGLPISLENADAIFDTILPNMAAGRGFGISLGTAHPEPRVPQSPETSQDRQPAR